MAVELNKGHGGKIMEVRVNGKLTRQDYRRFVPEFEQLVEQHGKVRVLFDMHDFHGWRAGALWEDIKFDLRHFADIERLALVGERRWEKGMSRFCRPFTTARIRYFDRAQADRARAWLEESLDAADSAQPAILPVLRPRAETRGFYNKISRGYDLLANRSEAPLRRAGLELLQARRGEQVLEIGFGTGHCLVALAKAVGPTGKVYGLDLAERMVSLAREKLRKERLLERVELRCGDALSLPYGADSLDAEFMSFTLELFDTPEIPRVLQECRRVLRPGGRLAVVGMSKDGSSGPMVKAYEWTHEHFPNFLDCRPIYVRRAMEQAGFEIKRALKKRVWVPVEIVLGIKSNSGKTGAPVGQLGAPEAGAHPSPRPSPR